MPDMHVVSLRYILQPDERFSYENPQPEEFETPEARFRLADGVLTCEMKMHFSDAAAAREVIDPILLDWEAWVDLRHDRGQLRFKFDKPEIIDRSPHPGGFMDVVEGADCLTMMGTVSVCIGCLKYPDPPPAFFHLNPDAESMLHRYHRYLDHGEPLPSFAYFCLTLLESIAGGRDEAVEKYRVSKNVLDNIGMLSSKLGDRMNARKAKTTVQPLSGSESTWLEAVVKKIVERLGDTRTGRQLPEITMADLPKP